MTPVKVFISYSHTDETLKKELEKHLNILRRNGQIEVWHDRKIDAGNEFGNIIDENLKTAQIILLLISSDFINSDYCYEIEMKEALTLHDKKNAIVIPVILRDCNWHKSPFGKLMALPTDGKAIAGKSWHNIDEAFTDVEKGIEGVIKNLKGELISSSKSLMVNDNQVDSKTIHEAIELFRLESEKLNYNSSKEDFKKFELLKRELYLQLFDDVNRKIENTPKLKEKQSGELFDHIWASEMLDGITIQEIYKIREEKNTYTWYERVITISAISLSLLTHRRFDQKKANLLIDFLTDFEENVWENALTGLVLALTHHKNKWDRFVDLKKRLEILQNIEKVQDSLNIIEYVLRYHLYKDSLFNPTLYNLSFFNTPSNCFLPFYKNNPILEEAIQNAPSGSDPDLLIEMVTKFPFLDSLKYSFCFAFDMGGDRKISKKEKDVKNINHFLNSLNKSLLLHPYQNIISEYYNFFKYYPKEKFEDIFSEQLSISKTKLKDVILNRVSLLKFTIDLKIDEENYLEAISKLLDLNKILTNDYFTHWNLAKCYVLVDNPNFNNALDHLLILDQISKEDINVLLKIAQCYFELGDHRKSIDFYEKCDKLNPKDEDIISGIAECYWNLKMNEKAIEILNKGLDALPRSFVILFTLGVVYSKDNAIKESIKYFTDSIAYCKKEDLYKPYRRLAAQYEDAEEFEKAIEFGLKAYKLTPLNSDVLWTLGRIYFTGKLDLEMASRYLEKSLKIKKEAIVYGNIGHVELCKRNRSFAKKNYLQCAKIMNNENEFIEKFNIDLKYILKYDITADEYGEIRDEVLEIWRLEAAS